MSNPTVLPKVAKEDLENTKYYLYTDRHDDMFGFFCNNQFIANNKVYSVSSKLQGAFYGPIEISG